MRSTALFGALLLASAPAAALAQGAPEDHGAKVYQRCAACHLPNGQGVPGAFPALAGRVSQAASTDAGRDYVVMAVVAGLMGEIDVDGKKIRGMMPAQAGLADADIAAALNHAAALQPPGAAAPKVRAFTGEEVAAIKARFDKATPISVHAIRSGAFPAAETAAQ
ncbi:MAG: c-type cytochrome [Pseudomonadota bacterium]